MNVQPVLDTSAKPLPPSPVANKHSPSKIETTSTSSDSKVKEDIMLRAAILKGSTPEETNNTSESKEIHPSDTWMEKQKGYLFRLIGYKIIDKKLAVAKLNLDFWGAPERLSEIVNTRDKNGKLPLEYAIDLRSSGHIEVLRKYGAEVTPSILDYGKERLPDYIYQTLT